MRKFFANTALSFSLVATLGITLLFFYFSNNFQKQKNQPFSAIATQKFDLTQQNNMHTAVVLDSLPIYTRPLLPFDTAISLLNQKLHDCKTDEDSIDVCAAFVYRTFDFGGTHQPEYPGEKWKNFSFEIMYTYGQYDSGGLHCGQRTRALEKLLQHIGFTDMIEFNAANLHTFLLVRTKQNKAWIADAYGMWGVLLNGTRADFVSYIRAVKQNSRAAHYFSVPLVFGQPDELLSEETFTGFWSTINNGFIDSVSLNPFCDTCTVKNFHQWLSNYLFISEDTLQFKYKLAVNRNFEQWAQTQVANYSAVSLWAAPNSVVPVSYHTVSGTDTGWATRLISEIITIRN